MREAKPTHMCSLLLCLLFPASHDQTLEGMVSGQRTPGRDGFPRVHVTVDTQMCNTGDQGLQGSFANRRSGRRSQLQALEEIKGREAATYTRAPLHFPPLVCLRVGHC